MLDDVMQYDPEANGVWPELDVAYKQLVDVVIPRLLGVLQSEGRQITPALVHGDMWENNVGLGMKTGNPVLFDPECGYGHNEMGFGTWPCTWAYNVASPIYLRKYLCHTESSEPAEEWDDRNWLYSIYPYITDSAGCPGSLSRKM
jgi:fructosamine-3-kinase